MDKLREAAREVVRQHSIECLSDKTVEALREALAGVNMSPTEPTDMNLNRKSVQARLATSWGYVKAEQAECKECGAKQAQIDRLMLEYCPDEMTPEQMQEWRDNQRPAEQAEQEPVAEVVLRNQTVGFGRTEERKDIKFLAEVCVGTKLYTHPVRTKDLTNDEIGSIYEKHHALGGCWTDGFAYERAVIAADREKNK